MELGLQKWAKPRSLTEFRPASGLAARLPCASKEVCGQPAPCGGASEQALRTSASFCAFNTLEIQGISEPRVGLPLKSAKLHMVSSGCCGLPALEVGPGVPRVWNSVWYTPFGEECCTMKSPFSPGLIGLWSSLCEGCSSQGASFLWAQQSLLSIRC